MALLLVQVRSPTDPMKDHEVACIRRRISQPSDSLRVINALTDDLSQETLQGVAGVLIGGSGEFGVHDEASQAWLPGVRDLLENVLSKGLPGFGICFGHQVLGLHLGGEVETSPEHSEVGTASYRLTEAGRSDPLFGALPEAFFGQTGHSDSVVVMPDSVELIAENDVLQAQAFRVKNCPFYSTQFHPDLLGAEARERYISYEKEMAIRSQGDTNGAERYVPGKDDAARLLGRFVGKVVGL